MIGLTTVQSVKEDGTHSYTTVQFDTPEDVKEICGKEEIGVVEWRQVDGRPCVPKIEKPEHHSAVIAHTRGAVQQSSCEQCSKGNGPIEGCVNL